MRGLRAWRCSVKFQLERILRVGTLAAVRRIRASRFGRLPWRRGAFCVSSRHGHHRGHSDCRGSLLHLLRSNQPARPGGIQPVRASHRRPRLRYQRPGAGRDGHGIPPDHHLQGHPAHCSRRDPRRGGQELLLPQRSRIFRIRSRRVQTQDPGSDGPPYEDGAAGLGGYRRDLPAGRIDHHPTTRARLFSQRP